MDRNITMDRSEQWTTYRLGYKARTSKNTRESYIAYSVPGFYNTDKIRVSTGLTGRGIVIRPGRKMGSGISQKCVYCTEALRVWEKKESNLFQHNLIILYLC